MTAAGRGPRARDVVLFGGFAVATLDIINATGFWYLYSGAPPAIILQAIAAGLLGKAAFAGGTATAALGMLLHYLIAFGMAVVYWLACRHLPVLLQRPFIAGIVYGALTYLAMNHVVVPLSRANPPAFVPAWFVDSLLAHLVLVGLLLAFVARWSANRR